MNYVNTRSRQFCLCIKPVTFAKNDEVSKKLLNSLLGCKGKAGMLSNAGMLSHGDRSAWIMHRIDVLGKLQKI